MASITQLEGADPRVQPRCRLRRRQVLGGSAALALSACVQFSPAGAQTPVTRIGQRLQELTGGAPIASERVTLSMPALAENGNSVSLTVEVASPMTQEDHVRAIHILSEKNPSTNVITFHLGPRAGRARVATSIRLADTQQIVALAETSDGRFYRGDASVIVTLAACIDTG